MSHLGLSDDDDEKSTNSNSNLSAHSAPSGAKNDKHLKVDQNSRHLPSSGDEDNDNFHRKKARKRLALTESPSYDTPARETEYVKAEGAYAGLSKQERREFRMAFRLFDKDDDGQISVFELKQVFEGLNYHFSEQQLIMMLKSIDDNDDGKVDIDEFVTVMKGTAYKDTENCLPYIEELREAFEVFDKDGDGVITPQELAAVMRALGEELNEQDIMNMIQEADADGDGNIDFDEFKTLMEEDQILGFGPSKSKIN